MRRISVKYVMIQSWWAIFAIMGLVYTFIGAFQGSDMHITQGLVIFFGCVIMAALSHIAGGMER